MHAFAAYFCLILLFPIVFFVQVFHTRVSLKLVSVGYH